jgi:hypothetical protein
MAKLTQYSRISHHTIYGATGSTFSVPSSEDFTDGTWNIYDLALSEIGVNETDKKAYMRIDTEVKEFAWAGTSTTGATNSIIMSDDSGAIYNSGIVVRQIAVTVSGAQITTLYEAPVTLVPAGGGTTTHQLISAYVRVNIGTGNWSGDTSLVIYEGGNGQTHRISSCLGTTQIRRYKFIPVDASGSLSQTQNDDAPITLSTNTANPTGTAATGTLTVYLTYTTYDESVINYE